MNRVNCCCYIIDLREKRLETSLTPVLNPSGHNVKKHLISVAKCMSSGIRGFHSDVRFTASIYVTLGKLMKLFVTLCPYLKNNSRYLPCRHDTQ